MSKTDTKNVEADGMKELTRAVIKSAKAKAAVLGKTWDEYGITAVQTADDVERAINVKQTNG